MAFNYSNYDGTNVDIVFSESNGYVEPSGEVETRKQLSYPFKELKDYINSTAIPTGGSTGQVLKKNSATDFDYSWQDVSDVSSSMSTNEIDFTDGTHTLKFRVLTANEYAGLATKDANTLYFIKES